MGKTYRNDPMQSKYDAEEELFDKLASQWARRVEAKRRKARA